MKRAVPRSSSLIALVVVAALAVASLGWAATPKSQAKKSGAPVSKTRATQTTKVAKRAAVKKTATAPAAPVAEQAGMRIFMDPETGVIGPPTPENIRILAAETAVRPDLNLPQYQLPHGGWAVDLDASQNLESLVMQIDKNGKRVVRCVHDEKSAHQHPVQVAPAREDR